MIRIIPPANEETNDAFAKWVMDHMGRPAVRPYRALAAIDEKERIVGGVVFNGYNGANVDLTAYAPGILTAHAINFIFSYAFVKLRATRITARTKRGLKTLLGGRPVGEALERMGFVREAVATHYYGEGRAYDAIVYRMLKSEWPMAFGGMKDGRRTRGARSEGNGRRAIADEPRNGRHADRAKRAKSVHADRLD